MSTGTGPFALESDLFRRRRETLRSRDSAEGSYDCDDKGDCRQLLALSPSHKQSAAGTTGGASGLCPNESVCCVTFTLGAVRADVCVLAERRERGDGSVAFEEELLAERCRRVRTTAPVLHDERSSFH